MGASGEGKAESQEGVGSPRGACRGLASRGPHRAAGTTTARGGRCQPGAPKTKSCTKRWRLSRAEARSHRICCASGQVCPSVCLPCSWLTVCTSACGGPRPLSAHVHTGVLGMQGGGVPSPFLHFSVSSQASSWEVAQTQERGKERGTVAISCPGVRP